MSRRTAEILLITLAWATYGTATLFDMLLAFVALLGLGGIWRACRQQGLRPWTLVVLGLGGGLLAKGPVVLLLVLPAALLAPW